MNQSKSALALQDLQRLSSIKLRNIIAWEIQLSPIKACYLLLGFSSFYIIFLDTSTTIKIIINDDSSFYS